MDNEHGRLYWPKEAILLMIEMWQTYECLFNPKNKFYHNKDVRYKAFNTIAEKVKVFNPSVGPTDIKNKLQYLRGQYTRELAKCEASAEDYVPTAYWFKELSFLQDFVKIRNRNILTDESENSFVMGSEASLINKAQPYFKKIHLDECSVSETDDFQSASFKRILELDDQPTTTTTNKRKKESEKTQEDEDLNKLLKSANDLLSQLTQHEDGESQCDESFIKLLKLNLRYITDLDLKDELSQKIISLIFEYKKKQRQLTS